MFYCIYIFCQCFFILIWVWYIISFDQWVSYKFDLSKGMKECCVFLFQNVCFCMYFLEYYYSYEDILDLVFGYENMIVSLLEVCGRYVEES